MTALDAPAEIWINDSPGQHSWVAIELHGSKSNRNGLGATIVMSTAGGTQHNLATSSVGYASSAAVPVHFGLGGEASIKAVTVRWPSGKVQIVQGVQAGRVTVVQEQP